MKIDPTTAMMLMRALNKRKITITPQDIVDMQPGHYELVSYETFDPPALHLELRSCMPDVLIEGECKAVEGEFKVIERS